jgi:hypothetical protein
MLNQVLSLIEEPRKRDMVMTGVGMAALLAGRKATAVTMFARGLAGLESQWRAAHPEFEGGLAERWAWSEKFYEQTHQDPTNRVLHVVGIPMIVAGTAGLVGLKPFSRGWSVAAGAFTVGWGLNFIGHGVFEKKAPAFADDPLGFLAGPVWDFKQLTGIGKGQAGS